MKSIEAGNATKDGYDGADYWLKFFGELPDYYVSEDEAISFGGRWGKSPAKFVPEKMIGGSVYRNSNNHLPDTPGRIWYEADITESPMSPAS